MKAFVIMNKEGKYLSYDDCGVGFGKSVVCVFVNRALAEEEVELISRNDFNHHIDDLDVVPIIIAKKEKNNESLCD